MTNNPYRGRGYTATFLESEHIDCMQIYRHGKLIAGVNVTVWPEGPNAVASIKIQRFVPNELRSVSTDDQFPD